jgi:hypothetical protein
MFLIVFFILFSSLCSLGIHLSIYVPFNFVDSYDHSFEFFEISGTSLLLVFVTLYSLTFFFIYSYVHTMFGSFLPPTLIGF